MSRSGYVDYDGDDQWDTIRGMGAIARATGGARGQRLLRDMLAALDAMPVKRLIASRLITPEGEVCALGAVAVARGLDVGGVDESEPDEVAAAFDIAPALAREIAFINDDDLDDCPSNETPEERFTRVRAWVAEQIRQQPQSAGAGS